MRNDMDLLCLRLFSKPINNPEMRNTYNVALNFPTHQHYNCSIHAKSDAITLLKSSIWSQAAAYAVAMRNEGIVPRSATNVIQPPASDGYTGYAGYTFS